MATYDHRAFARVIDRLICPSTAFLQELAAHYANSSTRDIFIFTANDVDALAAVHMLQDFLTQRLALRLVLQVISNYTELEQVFALSCRLSTLAQSSLACIFVNVGARSSVLKLLRQFMPIDTAVRHLWFVIDYQRPFAQLYVEQTLLDLHSPEANNVRCVMVCVEGEVETLTEAANTNADDESTATLRRLECLKEPGWKTRSQGILALLSASGGGEYFGHPSVLVLLEALKAHEAETARSILCTATGYSFHLLNSSITRSEYDSQLRNLQVDLAHLERRNTLNAHAVRFAPKEIYLPLLRFCSLKDTIRTCPVFLSSRLNTSGSWRDIEIDLGGIRLELDVDQAAWCTVATAELVHRLKSNIANVLVKFSSSRPEISQRISAEMEIATVFVQLRDRSLPDTLTAIDLALLLSNSLSTNTMPQENPAQLAGS